MMIFFYCFIFSPTVILLSKGTYDLWKMYSRRCPCGCWNVERIHSIGPEDPFGFRHTDTFGMCRGCNWVRWLKGDLKRFSPFSIRFREKWHPEDFNSRQELYRAAGISSENGALYPSELQRKPFLRCTAGTGSTPSAFSPFNGNSVVRTRVMQIIMKKEKVPRFKD